MNQKEFRAALVKVMPGYKWTIHRGSRVAAEFRRELIKVMPGHKCTIHRGSHTATGIQSAGFNRLSTLQIIRRERDGRVEYDVKSAGYGKRAPWISSYTGSTLRSALRGLQDGYESKAQMYSGAASDLKYARRVE